MRSLLALVAGALLLGSAPAENSSPWAAIAAPAFVRVDTQALPHPDVRRLAIDTSGFLWIGTPGGLARYDGYGYRNFDPNPSDPKALPDGWIHAMAAAPDGGLWIGAGSSGLVRYDARTQTFHTWHPQRRGAAGPRSDIVEALVQSADGHVWVGGDGGLDAFDPRAGTFAHVALANGTRRDPTVFSELIDHAHVLWIGTAGGLYYQKGAAFQRLGGEHAVAGDVWNLFEDSKNRLWASTTSGIYQVDAARTHTTELKFSANDASAIAPEQTSIIEPVPGTIWIGSGLGSISVVDTASGRVSRIVPDRDNPGGLAKGQITQFLRDPSGLIWIAKGSGGLMFFNPMSHGFYVLSATQPSLDLGEDGVSAIAAVRADRAWAGGLHGLVTLLDPKAKAATLTLPHHSTALAMFASRDGTVWVGATSICRIAAGAVSADCAPIPSALRGATRVDALLDEDDAMWIGTREGLIVEDRTGKVRTYRGGRSAHGLTNRWVTSLLRDRDGSLWVGTQAGLNRIGGDGRVAHFRFVPSDPGSFSPGVVDTLLQDRAGRIWAGTIGGQLDVLEKSVGGAIHIRHLGRADGLPHENVDGLAEDAEGRIWASTPRGIAMFEPNSFRARSFGIVDGVSGGANHAGSVSQAGGTIFFGGFDGVTIVSPGASSAWTYAPPLVVTALTLGRENVSPGAIASGTAPLQLPAGETALTVEFSALDYSDPSALHYRYKLDGFDRDWIATDATHRVAAYTNLPPGPYTLLVRATNRLGIWSDHTLAVRFQALPAWYETWWFRVLLLALLVAAAYGAHALRTAAMQRRQRELEALVEERTRELAEMSLTDPLTGLHNRRFLTQNIESEVALSERRYRDQLRDRSETPHDADLVFFMADVDHFKSVNDEYGHAAGDRVLSQMRERMEEVFRESDFLVRWGGEEFLAVARRTDRADASELAERLRRAVADRPFEIGDGKQLAKTASIGFVAFPFVPANPDAVGWLQIVELADEALYMAKNNGRNTWYGLVANEATAIALAQSPKIPIEQLASGNTVTIIPRAALSA